MTAPIKQRVVEAPNGLSENCPNCPNRGWWVALDEQHQCEWCYTVPHSRFNMDALAAELEGMAIVPAMVVTGSKRYCDWCGEMVDGPCDIPNDPCGLNGDPALSAAEGETVLAELRKATE